MDIEEVAHANPSAIVTVLSVNCLFALCASVYSCASRVDD